MKQFVFHKRISFLFPYAHYVLKLFNAQNVLYKLTQPYHHIIDNIYLGDFRIATDIHKLQLLNITHIINCAINLPNALQSHGVVYCKLPLYDTPSQQLFPSLNTALSFIASVPKSSNILVHCARGMSRSCSVVLWYLMQTKQMSYNEALAFTRGIRTIVHPHKSFQTQLINANKKFNIKH